MAGPPMEELQGAIWALLASNTSVASLVPPPAEGKQVRIYDEVPASPVFPYIVIGDDQFLDDSACGAAWEAVSTIHVFARPSGDNVKGKRMAKRVAKAIIAALGPVTLALTGYTHRTSADFESNYRDGRVFYEADRTTAHAVLTFGFLIDQAAED